MSTFRYLLFTVHATPALPGRRAPQHLLTTEQSECDDVRNSPDINMCLRPKKSPSDVLGYSQRPMLIPVEGGMHQKNPLRRTLETERIQPCKSRRSSVALGAIAAVRYQWTFCMHPAARSRGVPVHRRSTKACNYVLAWQ